MTVKEKGLELDWVRWQIRTLLSFRFDEHWTDEREARYRTLTSRERELLEEDQDPEG